MSSLDEYVRISLFLSRSEQRETSQIVSRYFGRYSTVSVWRFPDTASSQRRTLRSFDFQIKIVKNHINYRKRIFYPVVPVHPRIMQRDLSPKFRDSAHEKQLKKTKQTKQQ